MPKQTAFLNNGILNVNIQLSGWDQLLKATTDVQTQFITQSFDPGLNQLNNFLTVKMKEKMHYWTGKRKAGRPHMRDVTRPVKRGVLQYTTTVPVPYATAENRRPGVKPGFGSHNFVEPSVNQTIQQIPIFAQGWNQWIVNKFNTVKG